MVVSHMDGVDGAAMSSRLDLNGQYATANVLERMAGSSPAMTKWTSLPAWTTWASLTALKTRTTLTNRVALTAPGC